ncbi:MAG TPA: alpha/beta fold hydrolase [Candidatus Saccharimonadales bacterium]|nr:alpha/beta fold hydrolase [Candidatus Saccharimonadales bacterium]
MDPEQISIPITDYAVQADWYEGTDPSAVLLTFVGFSSSKQRNSEFIANVVAETGVSALVLDFSGHGKSPFDVNDTMPAQHLMEAVKAYDWIKTAYPDRTIHAMGTSYGGFMAAYLTRFRAVEKLILRTPATYLPQDFYTTHQYIDKIAARTYRKDKEALKKHPLFLQEALQAPDTLVVIHGKDEVVPVETNDIYTDEFKAKTYVAPGFVHAFRDPSNPQDQVPAYYQTICNWLQK